MKDKIVIVGLGANAKRVKRFIEDYDLFDIIGFSVNQSYITEDSFLGHPVYPLEELSEHIDKDNVYTFETASSFNHLNAARRRLYDQLKSGGFKVANLISPTAEIHTTDFGDGNWFFDHCYIGDEAQIGNNNIFNHFALIEHDAIIGDHNTITPRVATAGNVKIGDQCFLGINSTILNNVRISNKCIIGAGTLIKRSVPDFCLCKNMDGKLVIDQYTSETIENKLIGTVDPMYYEVNKKG